MNSPQAFDEEKYQALLCGLECSEVMMSNLNEEFRIDSEYYKQKYLKEDREIKQFHKKTIGELAFVTDGQHGYHEVDEFSDIHMLTAKNAKDWFANLVGAETVAKWVDENNKRSSLQVDDIILSTRGTIGCCAIVTDEILPANIDQDIARIEINDNSICSEFLLTYLNSRYGQDCMERNKTGMVQQGLTLQKVRNLNIPIMSIDFQNTIKHIIKDIIYLNLKLAEKRYQEAETILLTSLNLQNFTPSTKNTSVKSFSETFASGRLDAEYYQAKYDDLLERLHSQAERTILVNEICIINRRGIQPEYIDNGEIAVVNSKNILENGLDYENFSSTSSHLWKENPNAHIEKDDILIYTTGANIGRTAIYKKTLPAIASNHVNILRIKYEHPQYIAFVLNSMIGRLQTERISTGSAQQELYPKDIDNFVIPLVSETIQIGIEKLLNDSYILYEQSKHLLKAATRAVEIAIEESEAAALRYLEKMT